MKNIINPVHLENTENLHSSFMNAYPFKHTHVKDFLDESFLKAIREEFPQPPPPEKMINEFGTTTAKHAVRKIRELGPVFRAWDDLLKSDTFIDWVSEITGIEGLIYDPEYHGAGTHNNMHGQSMDVHVDFNYHRTTNYHRRLNLIVYISEEWEEEWGGALSLHKNPWNPDTDKWVSYPCFGNNAVFFETNEISWHGFSEVKLPEDKRHLSRKSLTVYYYSKERPQEEIAPKHTTIYIPNPISTKIKPGEILAEDDFLELRKNFAKRNHFLKALYERETQLLEVIDNQKHLIGLYSEAFQLPVVGFVKQSGKVQGVLPTMVVNDIVRMEIEPVKSVRKMVLEGYVPKFVHDGKNTLLIKIDGQLAHTSFVEDKFTLKIPVQKTEGEKFQVFIEPEKFVSPFEMGLNNDTTPFGFVFISLLFE